MTQQLPDVLAPAASPSPARSDGARAGSSADDFDGMLREQMKPAASSSEPSSNATGAASQSEAEAPDGTRLEAQAEPDEPSMPAEELSDGSVPAAIDADAEVPAGPAPRPIVGLAATVPGVAADEDASSPESLEEELAPRILRDGAAVVAGKTSPGAATKVPGAPTVAPGTEPDLQAIAEAASRAEPSLSASAESGSTDAPGATRAATPATGGQALTGFATALQATAAGATRVQVLEPVMVPVADPQWGAAVGSRLAVSVAQGVHSASIALNPQDLGPLQLTLVVNEDEASVTFVSNHAAVREAIEAALPRLREMLADEGITLTDVDVFSGGDRPGEGREGMAGDRRGDDAGDDSSAPVPGMQAATPARDSLVDTFA